MVAPLENGDGPKTGEDGKPFEEKKQTMTGPLTQERRLLGARVRRAWQTEGVGCKVEACPFQLETGPGDPFQLSQQMAAHIQPRSGPGLPEQLLSRPAAAEKKTDKSAVTSHLAPAASIVPPTPPARPETR